MTRIFDALKKAGAPRPAPAPAPAPASRYEPAIGSAALSRAPEGHAVQPVMGFPLAGMLSAPEEARQQMASLRVSLEAALMDRGTRTIAFVASQSGEGTTTVAHQFAASLAQDDQLRTVVVDANARHPSLLHDHEHRVVRLVHGDRSARDSRIAMNLHGWPVPAVVVEAGMFQPGAARAIVDGLARSYEWVILDLPPVLETPDAAALAALADGVVLVLQSGRTKRPVVSRSVDLLRKAGARVIGSVLNRRRLEIPDFIYKRI